MKRIVFGFWFFFIIYFLNFNLVLCLPQLLCRGELNNWTYFYCGNVKQVLLESDLYLLINNFDNISYKLVNYLNFNKTKFDKIDSRDHYNVFIDLQHHYLNYYYSFPFSHNSNLNYYEYFYNKDWEGNEKFQYWRPYIGVYNKNVVKMVKIEKYNINPNNYIVITDLKYKIYNILKLYINK